MVLKVASRGNIPPFIVMDVMRDANAREAAGAEVLHLEVGQPGGAAPLAVREAARRALEDDRIGYTDAQGLTGLRGAIAGHYRVRMGLDVDAKRIMATTGSSGGFLVSFLAAFEPDDVVAMAAPGYPAYRNILTALGIKPLLLECEAEHRFQPTVALLEAAGRVDGLIVASPSNPTGTMLTREAMADLVAYCDSRGIRLISDEIYHGIDYGMKPVSALEFTDRAVVINSFSKYFSMTGWRLGWMVLPDDLMRPAECLSQNFFISPPTLSQIAAQAVFDCYDELDAIVAGYGRNRALLLKELPKAGFDRLAPADGAFYLYAEVSSLTNDSEAFCRKMLAETGVACTPGTDFDPARGHRALRFSFAGPHADMATAAQRLGDWLRG